MSLINNLIDLFFLLSVGAISNGTSPTIFRSWASLNVNKVKSHKTKTNLGRVEPLVSPTDWTHPKRASKCLLQTFFLSLPSEEKKYKHFFFSDKKGRKKSSTQKQPICRLKRFLGEIYVWIASILFCSTRYLFSSCLSQLLFDFVVVRIESNIEEISEYIIKLRFFHMVIQVDKRRSFEWLL